MHACDESQTTLVVIIIVCIITGQPSDPLQIYSVDISPVSVQRGQNVKITIRAEFGK